MKHKRLLIFTILGVLALSLMRTPVQAIDIPDPDDSIYIQDFAGVLSESTKTYIITKNETLEDACGAQIVIATIDYTDGYDIEDYAYEMFNDYGIGDADKNNGVLLLLAIYDDNYWVMVGTGLETTLSGGVLKNLLNDYLEDDFANGDYDAGVISFFDAMYTELGYIYDLDTESTSGTTGSETIPTMDPAQNDEGYDSMFYSIVNGLVFFIVTLVIILGFMALLASFGRRRRYGDGSYPGPMRYRRPIYPFFFRSFDDRRFHTNDMNRPNYTPPGPTTRRSPSVRSPKPPTFGGGFGGGGFGGHSSGGSRSFGGGGSRGGGAGRK